MIKWKEKGWSATGLHHGLITAACYLVHPALGWCSIGYYGRKEWQEGQNRGGKLNDYEWLDFLTPLVINTMLVNWL